jgi:small-conductance mechanosensitive channel
MRLAFLLACQLLLVAAHAAETPEARERAAVKVANRTIIVLSGPIAGFSAKERAASTMERIERVLEDERLPAVTTELTAEGGTRVLVGGRHAFIVTPIDIDAQAGETVALVASGAAKRLESVIRERAEQSTFAYLARASALAAAATLAAGLLLLLLAYLYRRAMQLISDAARVHSKVLQVRGVPLLGTGHVLALARPLVGFAAWLAAILVVWAWLSLVLTRFPYTRPWGEQLGANLLRILGQSGVATLEALPGLLLVLVIAFVAHAVNRFARVFFDRIETGKLHVGRLDVDTARPTRQIFTVVVWVFALAMAYPYLPGASTEAFKGLSVLLGLMVSLGAASVVGQAFSGLIIMYTGAYRAGEYVRVGDVEGTVVDLGMFVTRIRTGLGEEVTLPSSTMMSAAIKNYSRSHEGTGFVLDTTVTIGYATPWRQVHAMLIEAARRTEGVVHDKPPPVVRQTALSDFSVEYRLVTYSLAERPRARAEVLSDLHANIQDVFNEYGVQIMAPNYEADPEEPKVVPKEKWYAPPAEGPVR